MIVNKKSRMALTALALSMLSPLSSAFAGDESQGWGRSAWNALTSPFALQTAGTLGSLGAANYLRGNAGEAIPTATFLLMPILASYLRYNQRAAQKPEERSHWSSYIINPMAANAAGLLSFYALTGNRPQNFPVVLALATAMGASFGSTSGYHWSSDEEFNDAKKRLAAFIDSNFNNPNINQNTLEELKTIYEQKRSKVPSPKEHLSVKDYIDYLILNRLVDQELLTIITWSDNSKPTLSVSSQAANDLIKIPLIIAIYGNLSASEPLSTFNPRIIDLVAKEKAEQQ